MRLGREVNGPSADLERKRVGRLREFCRESEVGLVALCNDNRESDN